jgi:hypothetical protein
MAAARQQIVGTEAAFTQSQRSIDLAKLETKSVTKSKGPVKLQPQNKN